MTSNTRTIRQTIGICITINVACWSCFTRSIQPSPACGRWLKQPNGIKSNRNPVVHTRRLLSEASRLFDADRLKAIIKGPGEQAAPVQRDTRLSQINQTITLIDGSVVSVLPSLTHASLLKQTAGSGSVQWRLHTHFEVDRYAPTRIDVTPNGGDEHDEREVAERPIEPDHLYVMDRGYAKFTLFNSIAQNKSSYVCRLRDNSVYQTPESRVLSKAAAEAGELGDEAHVQHDPLLFHAASERRRTARSS